MPDHHLHIFQLAALAVLKTKPPPRGTSPQPVYARAPASASPRVPLHTPMLPVEILERIVDFLHTDKNALIASSTVCRALFPTSRYHLYTLLPVVPVLLSEGCHKVNTAVPLGEDSMLYGTDGGVYLSRGGGPQLKLLKVPAVSQIDVLQEHNMLLVLSGRRLLVGPLHLLAGPNPGQLQRHLEVLASDASFFQVGDHAGKRVVCAVAAGRFSSHFKVLEAVAALPAGPHAAAHALAPFRSFYLPDHARSVHIWNKTMSAALRTGFLCVDPLSLVTFPVPVADAGAPAQPGAADGRKCRAMFRIDDRFLLCHDRCAFFIDKLGASSEAHFCIRWAVPVKQFALSMPYLLGFSAAGLQVWRLGDGAHVQSVHGAGMRLLCAAPRIIMKMGDGRVVALRCRGEQPMGDVSAR